LDTRNAEWTVIWGKRRSRLAKCAHIASGWIVTRRYISRKLGGSIFGKMTSIATKLFRVAYLYDAVAGENWPTSSPVSSELFMHVISGIELSGEEIHIEICRSLIWKSTKIYTVPKLFVLFTIKVRLTLLYSSWNL